MDSEIVDKVKALVEQAQAPVVTVPGEDGAYFFLRTPDGQIKPQRKRVHERRAVLSLASLADFARVEYGGDFWYSRTGVVYRYTGADAHVENADRTDRATLALKPSKQIELLARWSEGRHALKQEEAVRLLRTVFREQAEPGTLAESVAAISWKVDERGQSVVGQASRSVGKNLEAKIEGRHQLPEVVTFEVPVWESGGPTLAGLSYRVGCVLEADAPNQTFTFLPFAGSVEKAWAAAEDDLRELLNAQVDRAFARREGEPDEDVPGRPPVFHGRPD